MVGVCVVDGRDDGWMPMRASRASSAPDALQVATRARTDRNNLWDPSFFLSFGISYHIVQYIYTRHHDRVVLTFVDPGLPLQFLGAGEFLKSKTNVPVIYLSRTISQTRNTHHTSPPPTCLLTSSPPKMFYIIGLGLCDEKDITIRGLEVCCQNSSLIP